MRKPTRLRQTALSVRHYYSVFILVGFRYFNTYLMITKKDTRKNLGACLLLKPSLFILEFEQDSPYYIEKIHKPINICSTCNAEKIEDKCFICNPPF